MGARADAPTGCVRLGVCARWRKRILSPLAVDCNSADHGGTRALALFMFIYPFGVPLMYAGSSPDLAQSPTIERRS